MSRSFGTPEKDIAVTNASFQETLVVKNLICGQIDALSIAANKFDGLVTTNSSSGGNSGGGGTIGVAVFPALLWATPASSGLVTIGDNLLTYQYKNLDTAGTFNLGASTYVVSKSGTYSFGITVSSGAIGINSDLILKFNVNGTTVASSPVFTIIAGAGSSFISFFGTAPLVASDAVTVTINKSGGNATLGSNGSFTLTQVS